jgi:hypothetical protein
VTELVHEHNDAENKEKGEDVDDHCKVGIRADA